MKGLDLLDAEIIEIKTVGDIDKVAQGLKTMDVYCRLYEKIHTKTFNNGNFRLKNKILELLKTDMPIDIIGEKFRIKLKTLNKWKQQ